MSSAEVDRVEAIGSTNGPVVAGPLANIPNKNLRKVCMYYTTQWKIRQDEKADPRRIF
jgi:hypothetical protein